MDIVQAFPINHSPLSCKAGVFNASQNQAVMDLVAFFLSLSLLGVILIAFQQAQYILMEFMKTRQRQNASSSSQQSSGPVDVIGPHSHK
ncbi:Transmembrane protein 131-like [Camelus dromedarius]|uniref:Transmembrane protein 131-like n=1 Tax=Camelus dromedarius TaxID=9838 RepID=A0A5N4EI89_CAMDR|nr:Transmembrane protein 131-like [Camelus dromedarius]